MSEQPGIDDSARAYVLTQLEFLDNQYKDNQEWIMTRDVQEIHMGVIGTAESMKTTLLTMYTESVLDLDVDDEKNGRCKSKITVDGRSKLLLIREETGAPSKQLCQWVDVILLVFNYADENSFTNISEFYKRFRETRENQDIPVIVTGILPFESDPPTAVKDADVKKLVDQLERCVHINVALQQSSVVGHFVQACRFAMAAGNGSLSPLMSQQFSQSPSLTNLAPGGVTKISGSPYSPLRKRPPPRAKPSKIFTGQKSSYNLGKGPQPTYGTGRHIPVKEGHVNKKHTGIKTEWKKKYLVLSQSEITYYPSMQDYMTQTHGKSLNIQNITVRMPGKRMNSATRLLPAPVPVILPDQPSDENSPSPPLDTTDHPLPLPPKGIPAHPVSLSQTLDIPANLLSGEEFSSNDNIDEIPSRVKFSQPDPIGHTSNSSHHRPGKLGGHNRNSSMDEFMLHQLHTAGISYGPVEDGGGALPEKAATMSRLPARPVKEKGKNLTPLGSEEALYEGGNGSNEKLRQGKRKGGEKVEHRNSMVLGEKTPATTAAEGKDRKKKGHQRERSWGGDKLLLEGDESNAESAEFEIVSSAGKIWSFGVSSSEEAEQWVKAIELRIKETLSGSISHKRMNSSNELEKQGICSMEGNDVCADCSAPKPEWASLNLGCLLCIECSGVHRMLGSHISRVRSLTLDEWTPELIAVMVSIGNKVSKSIWEAKKIKSRPAYNATREEREKFIRAKYVDKEFLADLPADRESLPEQLMDCVKEDNINRCVNVLAHATPEEINRLHGPPEDCTPLHMACTMGRTVLVELLIWNGANMNLLDANKRTPMQCAQEAGRQDCINILVVNNYSTTHQQHRKLLHTGSLDGLSSYPS